MSNASPTPREPAPGQNRPWWKEYMLWIVLGGPALVVVASFVTLSLALNHPDPVLEPGSKGSVVGSAADGGVAGSARASTEAAAYVPAMQGRNHAATGGAAPGK